MSPREPLPEKSLTEVELELMTILWQLGGGTVNEVMAALPEGRTLAYTSVSTILRILEQKGVLSAEKVGRG
ncbi:MAG TPA: BlaI/MecI/CopY family transcriptional regulator, partial [Polyangia bacterium]